MATSTTTVGAPPKSGELLSERIAPGILPKVLGRFDMIAIFVAIVLFAVLVVNLLQFFLSLPPFNVVNPLGALWQQGIIILAVIWFSSALSILRFRVTQNLVNGVFVIYGAAILTVGLAGLAWLLGGHSAANDFSRNAFGLNSGNATFYGLVILALLG